MVQGSRARRRALTAALAGLLLAGPMATAAVAEEQVPDAAVEAAPEATVEEAPEATVPEAEPAVEEVAPVEEAAPVETSAAVDIAISDVYLFEGNSFTTNMVFNVTLSAPAPGPVSVKYKTTDGSATAPSDYTAKALTTLSFAAGQSAKAVTVAVKGDKYGENDEYLFLDLSAPVNANLPDPQGFGYISNDDAAAPYVSVDYPVITEGDSGTKSLVFTFSLSEPAAVATSLKYYTGDGTATAPSDYTAKVPTTLTFPAGTTTKTATVTVKGDLTYEADEYLYLYLSDFLGLQPAQSYSYAYIVNNDAYPPSIYISDAQVTEANVGQTAPKLVFTVALDGTSNSTVSVKWHTASQTAVSPGDFTAQASTLLSFAPGQTLKTVSVTVKPDDLGEPDEVLAVVLGNAVNATIADGGGYGTIFNDDPDAPVVTINTPQIVEGNSFTSNLVFTVSLSAPAQGNVSLTYRTADGSAVAPGDYTAKPSTKLSFTKGQTSKTFTIAIKGDVVPESTEYFYVQLFDASDGLVIGQSLGYGYIYDND